MIWVVTDRPVVTTNSLCRSSIPKRACLLAMSALRNPESRLLVFVLALLTAGAAIALRSGPRSPPPQRSYESADRRSFLTKTLASAASVSLIDKLKEKYGNSW